jgi:putative oxidoreductase
MTATVPANKNLNIALWVVQVLLAAAFLMAGLTKLTTPITQLSVMMAWTASVPELMVRFIALAEVLGAIGLLLPSLSKIQPSLTTLAALGLSVVMALAVLFHITRGEFGVMLPSLILGALSAFVAWGRRQAPITARS